MVPEFANALFDAEDPQQGDIIGPVRSQFGWHVIMFDEARAPLAERLAAVQSALSAEGADFATVAAELSDGAEAAAGGETGWHVVDDLDAASQLALDVTDVGQRPRPWRPTRAGSSTGSSRRPHRPLEGAARLRKAATAFDDWYRERRLEAEDARSRSASTPPSPRKAPRRSAPDGDEGAGDRDDGRAHQSRDRDLPGRCAWLTEAPVWFTGLSGSGKSTTADGAGAAPAGAWARGHGPRRGRGAHAPSTGLGFSREDRDTNVRRIGFVAGGDRAPRRARRGRRRQPLSRQTRAEVREMVGARRPLRGGLRGHAHRRRARRATSRAGTRGLGPARSRGFTGVDDPYEPPLDPEITLHTTGHHAEANARLVLDELETHGDLVPA